MTTQPLRRPAVPTVGRGWHRADLPHGMGTVVFRLLDPTVAGIAAGLVDARYRHPNRTGYPIEVTPHVVNVGHHAGAPYGWPGPISVHWVPFGQLWICQPLDIAQAPYN